LARFPEESYRQCPHCGIIYLARLGEPPIEYERDYFFSDYKKQYGKTYLEDFPGLVEAGKRRLGHIMSLSQNNSHRGTEITEITKEYWKSPELVNSSFPLCVREPKVRRVLCAFVRWILSYLLYLGTSSRGIQRFTNGKPRILDVGCAYGPFLAAAAECGFSPAGVEPASDAARYVKEELGFPCYNGFFPAANAEEIRRLSNDASGSFDAVTMWYVIEHFEEVGKVLMEIHALLKEGGALAFSTPSFSGVSGRKSLASFLKNSPPDHYTIWSPQICAWILRRYGFRLRKIVVTGHHPERFPVIGRLAGKAKKGVLYRFLVFISRLFRLGDTFEVYAVKG